MFTIRRQHPVQRPRRLLARAAALLTLAAATLAQASTFMLAPRDLGDGFSFSGTISTDGTVGALSAANITGWSLTVVSVSDTFYTSGNTSNRSSGVMVSGGQLVVPTSPDGQSDGGVLAFGAGARYRVNVADFTGPNVAGGLASYVHGGAFAQLELNRPDGINHVAAVANPGGGNRFDLLPLVFDGGAAELTGTLTTDGQTGAANLVDWNLRLRETMSWVFDPSNSSVLFDLGLATDGRELTVTPQDAQGDPGAFVIGAFNGLDLNGVLLADFGNDPTGQAGYVSPLAFQVVNGLPLNADGRVVVALAAPEPASAAMVLLGLMLAGMRARAGRERV